MKPNERRNEQERACACMFSNKTFFVVFLQMVIFYNFHFFLQQTSENLIKSKAAHQIAVMVSPPHEWAAPNPPRSSSKEAPKTIGAAKDEMDCHFILHGCSPRAVHAAFACWVKKDPFPRSDKLKTRGVLLSACCVQDCSISVCCSKLVANLAQGSRLKLVLPKFFFVLLLSIPECPGEDIGTFPRDG